MRDDFLSFAPPAISEEEVEAVVSVMRSGWLTAGPKVKEFEGAFTSFVGATDGLALNSCTSALHLALIALEVGPGDKVITTPMTFPATANVIRHVGADVVFVDVEPATLNINPQLLSEVFEANGADIKAVMPVHFAGHPCRMDELRKLCADWGAGLVADAAHAVGASYGGVPIGNRQGSLTKELCCFSFYATKNLTTGEGGMLTASTEMIERARGWSLHGLTVDARKRYEESRAWYYEVKNPGFKYNMTDISAAMGLVQLRRLSALQRRRREIAQRYEAGLTAIEELELPSEHPGVVHAWHLYVIRLNRDRLRISRSAFIEELSARRVGASVHFIPVHMHPYYAERYSLLPTDLPVAAREYERTISLPIYPGMTDTDVDDVIEAVTDIVELWRL